MDELQSFTDSTVEGGGPGGEFVPSFGGSDPLDRGKGGGGGCGGEAVSPSGRDEYFAKFEIATLGVIFILDIIGNSIVVLVLRSMCRVKKLSRMNAMIAHLTGADFFVGFFNVLPMLAWKITFRFQGGALLCKIIPYMQLVAMFASSYVLVTTAIDRYSAICHPLKMHAWTARRMHSLVALAWLLAFLFSLPQTLIFSFVQIDNDTTTSLQHVTGCDIIGSDDVTGSDVTGTKEDTTGIGQLIMVSVSVPGNEQEVRERWSGNLGKPGGNDERNVVYDCKASFEPLYALPIYITWITLSIFVTPLIILIILYANICLAVWHSVAIKDKRRGGGTARSGGSRTSTSITFSTSAGTGTYRREDSFSGTSSSFPSAWSRSFSSSIAEKDFLDEGCGSYSCGSLCWRRRAGGMRLRERERERPGSRSTAGDDLQYRHLATNEIHPIDVATCSEVTDHNVASVTLTNHVKLGNNSSKRSGNDAGQKFRNDLMANNDVMASNGGVKIGNDIRTRDDCNADGKVTNDAKDRSGCNDDELELKTVSGGRWSGSAGQVEITPSDVIGEHVVTYAVMTNDVPTNDVMTKDVIKNDATKNDVIKNDVITNDLSRRPSHSTSDVKTSRDVTTTPPDVPASQNAAVRRRGMMSRTKAQREQSLAGEVNFEEGGGRRGGGGGEGFGEVKGAIASSNEREDNFSEEGLGYEADDKEREGVEGSIGEGEALMRPRVTGKDSSEGMGGRDEVAGEVGIAGGIGVRAEGAGVDRGAEVMEAPSPPCRGSTVRNVSSAKLRTVKLTLVIIASYIICYGPWFFSLMWTAWDETAPYEGYEMAIIMLLASLNSCTNPWIYLSFNGHLPRPLGRCLNRLIGRRQRLAGVTKSSHRRGQNQGRRWGRSTSEGCAGSQWGRDRLGREAGGSESSMSTETRGVNNRTAGERPITSL